LFEYLEQFICQVGYLAEITFFSFSRGIYLFYDPGVILPRARIIWQDEGKEPCNPGYNRVFEILTRANTILVVDRIIPGLSSLRSQLIGGMGRRPFAEFPIHIIINP